MDRTQTFRPLALTRIENILRIPLVIFVPSNCPIRLQQLVYTSAQIVELHFFWNLLPRRIPRLHQRRHRWHFMLFASSARGGGGLVVSSSSSSSVALHASSASSPHAAAAAVHLLYQVVDQDVPPTKSRTITTGSRILNLLELAKTELSPKSTARVVANSSQLLQHPEFGWTRRMRQLDGQLPWEVALSSSSSISHLRDLPTPLVLSC